MRQALYAQRYLVEHFGAIATVGCNVDPFGHNATLPQLLAQVRMDAYTFLRPSRTRWSCRPRRSGGTPDGSRVLAYRIPHEYCAPDGHLRSTSTKALDQLPPDTTDR